MTPSALVLINFKYGTNAKPLVIVAYSQLAAKALLLADKRLSEKQIAQRICGILGIKQASTDLVGRGLALLAHEKIVEKVDGNRWKLTSTAQHRFDLDVKTMEASHNDVLANNFPTEIDAKKLGVWFSDASAAFFEHFSKEWVTSVAKGNRQGLPGELSLTEILGPTIDAAGLQNFKNALVKGYSEYLQSSKPSDQESLMSMGLAAFSAQLVAADLGADPVGLAELKDATFYLDTNIFVSIVLNDRLIKTSLRALSSAFKTINARLIYTPYTRDEYRGLIAGKKQSLLKIIDQYDAELLAEKFEDDFYKAALKSGCKTREDFLRFFEQIEEMPAKLEDEVPLTLEEDDVTEATAQAALKDSRLKATIQHAYRTRHRTAGSAEEKSDSSLEHDAVLINAANQTRKEIGKCWVLTMDRTLQVTALGIVGINEVPVVISLDTFIEILALDSMGPGYDPANFAPLLASMLLARALPHKDAFQEQDFQWLASIMETATDLPPEEAEKLLNIVRRHRLRGSAKDAEALRLEVNRAFQTSTKEISKQMDEALARAKKAEQELESLLRQGDVRDKALEKLQLKEDLRLLDISFAREAAKRGLATLVVTGVFYLVLKITPAEQSYAFWLAILIFALSSLGFFTKPLRKYRTERRQLKKKIHRIS